MLISWLNLRDAAVWNYQVRTVRRTYLILVITCQYRVMYVSVAYGPWPRGPPARQP